MDASAILKGHGWRGAGHSLDHHGRGIVKPLLISNKQDLLGVGKKKPAHNVSDQWWMRAFDESLKEFGTGKKASCDFVRETGINRGGLYGFFVKGEGLSGTVTSTDENSSAESLATTNPQSGSSTPPTSTTSSSEDMAIDESVTLAVAQALVNDDLPKESKKRKRQKGESNEDVRKRRKSERQEKVRQDIVAKREKAAGEGTVDPVVDAEKKKMEEINRKATMLIKSASKRGKYGPVLPHPSTSQSQVSTEGNVVEDPERPGKKLTYKAAKYAREKAMRTAKRELKARLIAEAQARGELPNSDNLSPEELLEKHEKAEKAKSKDQGSEKQAMKTARMEEKERAKQERREAKKARQLLKSENRRKTAEAHMEARRQKEERLKSMQDFASNPDEIKFGVEVTGQKLKKVPGYGYMEKYPSAKEKKERKQAAQAEELGISVEELKVKLDAERKTKELLSVQKPLTAEEKEKYAARAAEKGMTIEAYVARRIEKKEEKKAAKKSEEAENNAIGFVVDTIGNKNLLARADLHVSTELKPIAPDGTLPRDPALWEGRPVKSLTKAERKARLEWMRERRRQRKEARGESGVSKAEKSKRRAEMKIEMQRNLTRKLLVEQGKEKGATKEDVETARRRAKKILKEEKKERKGKANKLAGKEKGRHRVSRQAKLRNAGGRNE
ncbi:hypothetical protein K432DRAFT_288745 [Lepidopterella palustris CBS 459.81]|uniref:G-patch domain-containing protein n=1 Tax=Lepidopterella palustris CBS 459.81 TaxID=1314670 RepID=A0A8E2EIS0_9PEZI|nr:hypothetical protein K432DRAFT_288745 [Lepidopterella palustris CBS 459.81]